jgi:MFS family permease
MTNVGAIADELADAYSTSLLMVGAFTAALFLGHSASQIPAGHVIDRVGPRAPALVAVALTVGAGLAALIAPSHLWRSRPASWRVWQQGCRSSPEPTSFAGTGVRRLTRGCSAPSGWGRAASRSW